MRSMMWKKHLLGWVCFLLNVNLQSAYCDATYHELLNSTLSGLCPYSSFCTIDPSKPFTYTGYSPCCKPCSCDDDCLITGNCCPDFLTARQDSLSKVPTATCSSPVHYGSDYYITRMPKNHLNYGVYYHYITSTCPVEYSNHEVINKCINVNTQDLKNAVVVSDGRGRAFSNRYCAICNGVKSFTRWDLKLICREYTDKVTDIPDVHKVNDNDCMILSSPPTTDIAMKSRCFPVQYDTCNVTGKWGIFDSTIERACISTTYPFVKNEFRSTTTYKNPYCYLCNTAADVRIHDICPSDDANIIPKEVGGVPFAAILDIAHTGKDKTEAMNQGKCLPFEVFDNHFGTCRLLNCPITFRPQNGKCAQVFTETSSLSIYILSDATFVDKTTRNFFNSINQSDQKQKISILEEIVFDLFFKFLKNEMSCDANCHDMCTMLPKPDNTGMLFALRFPTNRNCHTASIIKSIKRWAFNETYISVYNNDVQLAFTLKLLYESLSQLTPRLANGYEMLFSESSSISCTFPLPIKPLFYCANVDIPLNDYTQIIKSDTNTFHPSDFTVIRNGNGSDALAENVYRICVDKYLGNRNGGFTVNTLIGTNYIAMAAFGLLYLHY